MVFGTGAENGVVRDVDGHRGDAAVRVAELAQVVLWQARGMRSTARGSLSEQIDDDAKMHYFPRDDMQR